MNEDHKQPELSVVILCYRAEDFAPVFVGKMEETLKKSNLDYELVLVANYQKNHPRPDRTPEIVRKMAETNSRLVVVAKEKEGMMGWDMRTGLAAARGKVIAVIDGDGQMPPEDIIKIYGVLKSGNYDMAKTYRVQRFDGVTRIVISKFYNTFFKILFPKAKVRDVNSKPKMFTRAALDALHLTADDWFIDAEIMILAGERGFKIGQAPTDFFPNENRKSFVKFTAIFEFMLNLCRYRIKLWKNKV